MVLHQIDAFYALTAILTYLQVSLGTSKYELLVVLLDECFVAVDTEPRL